MKAKNKRHAAILDLIRDKNVETQDDLTAYLSEMGIKATQATVSRDIKELHLVKVLDKSTGSYKYEQRGISDGANTILPSKSSGILRDGIISFNLAQNFVIIKCYTGMANAVCAALDAAKLPEIIGTIAGDYTIFVATASGENAVMLREDMQKLISGGN